MIWLFCQKLIPQEGGGEVWAVTQTPSEMDVGPRKSQNYFDHLKITNATQGNTDNSHNPSKQA